ncbi:MAG: hypothetical protein Q8O55_00960 [Dehalococcoidales bacterium]|nr:hypothetical protein [Dehalococcoidales bacterium]
MRLNRKQGEWITINIPAEGKLKQGNDFPVNQNDNGEFPTLKDVGIDYHDSPKYRLLANIPEAKFEQLRKDILKACGTNGVKVA